MGLPDRAGKDFATIVFKCAGLSASRVAHVCDSCSPYATSSCVNQFRDIMVIPSS